MNDTGSLADRAEGRRVHRGVLGFAAVTVIAVAAAWLFFAPQRLPIEEGRWIGWDEKRLTAELGPATTTTAGYVQVGSEPAAKPAGPYKTLYYRQRGGHLYIWLHRRSGRWLCFDSLWFDNGVEFSGGSDSQVP